MIDTIIFDVGGVLFENNIEYVLQDISKTLKLDRPTVDKAWKKLIPLLGKGSINEQEFWKRFIKVTRTKEKLPHESLLVREYASHFVIFPKVKSVILKLKRQGYKLGIISDTIQSHADFIRTMGMFTPFDVVVLSFEVGLRKPDPKIFALALKKLNSKPEATIFVDDNPSFIAEAKKLGFEGIVFKSERQLISSLGKMGLQHP